MLHCGMNEIPCTRIPHVQTDSLNLPEMYRSKVSPFTPVARDHVLVDSSFPSRPFGQQTQTSKSCNTLTLAVQTDGANSKVYTISRLERQTRKEKDIYKKEKACDRMTSRVRP